MEKRYSSTKESSVEVQSSLIVNLERKSTTTLSFLGLSKIVISNSCNNNNHRVTLPLVIGFFHQKLNCSMVSVYKYLVPGDVVLEFVDSMHYY